MNGRSGPKVMVSRACSSSHSTRPKRCCVGRQASRCSPSGSSSVIHATKSSSSVPEGKTAERHRGCGESRRLGAVAAAGFGFRSGPRAPRLRSCAPRPGRRGRRHPAQRIGSKSEIQLLRCGHDNLAGAKRVLVDVADPPCCRRETRRGRRAARRSLRGTAPSERTRLGAG
jgi:hypothetical protein